MPQRYDPIHDVLVDTEDKPETEANGETSTKDQETEPETTKESTEQVVNEEIQPEPKEDEATKPKDETETKEESKDSTVSGTADINQDGSQDTEEEVIEPEPESEAHPSSAPKPTEASDTPNKKHKLSPSPTKTPLKKLKKQNAKSATVLSSARSRHLKKDDGRPFLRKDIQFQFLKDLFESETRAFIDPYEESKERVITEPFSPHKLTFAELYIKTIAHSSKCSKILRDRLLNDMNMSIPTSMICLLVNVGRMNTTINFVPDMKSQLRTYHSIPCLQVDYDASENKFNSTGNGGDKQLQDTPRLKSILKACCDDTDEPNALNLLENVSKLPKTNVINIIFLLCNAEESINKTYLEGDGYGFFDIFMNSDYDPKQRVQLFLWLIFAYLETDLSELEQREKNPFGAEIPSLTKIETEYDVDTPEEVEFGNKLYEQRVKFLAEDISEQGDEANKKNEKVLEKKDKKSSSDTPLKQNAKVEKTPAKQQAGGKPKAESNTSHTQQHNQAQSTKKTFQFPVLPKNDIDTDSVRRSLKYLGRIHRKKRAKAGQLKFEHKRIEHEEKLDEDDEQLPQAPTSSAGINTSAAAATTNTASASGPAANRLRLKDYKGDYAENNDKFYKLFNLLKNDFVEMAKADAEPDVTIHSEYQDTNTDLTLTKFSIDL